MFKSLLFGLLLINASVMLWCNIRILFKGWLCFFLPTNIAFKFNFFLLISTFYISYNNNFQFGKIILLEI